MPMNERAAALAARLNKEMPGSLMLASEMSIPRRYTTGSLSIDVALGGGFPANQWYENSGKESHGKTALTLKTVAANQAADPKFTTLWVAGEHYDTDQAAALGVDNDRVIVRSGQEMEDAFQTVLDFIGDRAGDLVVVDSYPALIPNDESDKDMDEFSTAAGARVMAKFFRKMGKAGKRDPHDSADSPWFGVMVNQPRVDIGAYSPRGPAYTTPGGLAKNFAFYARLEVKRKEWIEEKVEGVGKSRVGQTIYVTTVKNKGGPPQRVGTVDFYFTDAPHLGFSRGDYDVAKDIVVVGLLFDVIHRAGKYYTFQDVRWSPKEQMYQAVKEDLGLQEKIRDAVLVAAARPDDKRSWDEGQAEAAAEIGKPKRVVQRRPR